MTCRYSVKYHYHDESAAIAGAQKIKITKGVEYDQLYPYPCPDGPHWHLSHHEQGIERCGTCSRLVPAWKGRWWVIAAHHDTEGEPCAGEGAKAVPIFNG